MNSVDTNTLATAEYALISPKQFYERINASLQTRLGINTIYKLVRSTGFPSVKIGSQYYIIENKVADWLENMSKRRK